MKAHPARAPRVAAMFGGRSVEHEVSVITAHQGMDALKVAGYDVLPIYVSKQGYWFAGEPLYDLRKYEDLTRDFGAIPGVYRVSLSPDRGVRTLLVSPEEKKGFFRRPPAMWADVFFPMIHGSFGEDGTLQGVLEMADVPYVGCGVLAAAVAMDKVVMKEICRANGLPTVQWKVFSGEDVERDTEGVAAASEAFAPCPIMVKPVHLGSSIGVRRCDTRTSLVEALGAAAVLDCQVMVEPALSDFMEINCSVIGPPTEVSVCEQPVSTGGVLSFDAKYRRGGKAGAKSGAKTGGMASLDRIVPAPISEELAESVRSAAARAFEVIGAAGVARVDFLYDKTAGQLYFNEINSLPGSLAFYLWEASGVPFDRLVSRLVDTALALHHRKSATTFTFDANLLRRPSP